MENILNEPIQTSLYFKEYLTKIINYKNLNRPSLFIRYYNINVRGSSYNDDTKGTFDHYNSGILYDLYDYTPSFTIAPITNTSTDKSDMSGLTFDALGEITVYTIENPRMGDLISFPYGPSKTDETFRVIQIDTSIHVREFGVRYHKLTLEYAPIKDLNKLNILNSYVYLLSEEKNVLQVDYINKLDTVQINKDYLFSIESKFNPKYELYFLEDEIASLSLNQQLYDFLAKETYQNRFFDLVKKPFGVKNYNSNFTDKGINKKGEVVDYTTTYVIPLI